MPRADAYSVHKQLDLNAEQNTGRLPHMDMCCCAMQFSSVAQSCPTPSDPLDCSPQGRSVHGIFQARVLEWVAIAFSDRIHRRK